jgi:hypothetical protein
VLVLVTQSGDWSTDRSRGGQLIPLSDMQSEDVCPVLQYYYSGFLALQSLIDHTKIKVIINYHHVIITSTVGHKSLGQGTMDR